VNHSFTTLEKIAKALGISISELFATTDEIKEEKLSQ